MKMISPDLTHTEVQLDRGQASVEADQLYSQNRILIDQKGGQTQLIKNGLYEFNADNNTVRTFDGKAAVYRGADLQSDVKPIDVKGGRTICTSGVVCARSISARGTSTWLRSTRVMVRGLVGSIRDGTGTRGCTAMTGCLAEGRSGARSALGSTRLTTFMAAALCMGAASTGEAMDTGVAMGSVERVAGWRWVRWRLMR